MIEYTEQAQMVDALRACAEGKCSKCPFEHSGWDCDTDLITGAAGMIESLRKEVEELRREIADKDKEIEDLKREIMTYPDEVVEREERCGL